MSTKTLVYKGPHRGGVTLCPPDGGAYEFAYGKPTELPADLADQLLADQPQHFTIHKAKEG